MTPSAIRLPCALLALAAACSTSSGPVMSDLDDQVVAVGDQLELEISASNESGSPISFDFSSNAPGDGERTALTVRPDGTGLFTWTPNAEDVGNWTFDFVASDASGRTTESVVIDVRSAVGAATMPIFRRPLGSGTAVQLDPEGTTCLDLELSATDQDSTEVIFAEEEPRIEGAELLQETEFEAVWHWCPTEAQRRAQDRYLLTLSADDGENPKAIKRYQIILRDAAKPNCAGEAPVIAHTAVDQTTVNPITVDAHVTDESGLKAAPLVYYMTPAQPTPVQLTMTLKEGDTRDGQWTVEVPNPLDGATSARLVYEIVAEDNDDSGGDCDHITSVTFDIGVTSSGGEGGRGLCEACTDDVQCGGPADHCLLVGTDGSSFCFTACDDTPGSCPAGYACSAGALTSVDGASARQCVPLEETCTAPDACLDDSFEQNDGVEQAQALPVGLTTDLRMCPVGTIGADEDWYEVVLAADGQVDVRITGDTYPNLELSMVDATGNLVAASEDWGSDDSVSRCLAAGTYYVRVFSYFSGESDYSVEYTTTPMSCETVGGECVDDAFEDDDAPTLATARVPDFEDLRFTSTGNQICSGDRDFFFVHLFDTETLHGTLTFEHLTSTEDLDFLVFDGAGTLLTICTEDDVSGCDFENGQSSDSNETLTFVAPPGGGDFFIAVNGFNGSEQGYDICLSLEAGACVPPP